MGNVDSIEGLRYGLRLIGFFGVVVGAGLGTLVGSEILFNPAHGGPGSVYFATSVVVSLVLLGGLAGIQYKVIADGVERGIRASRE
jgi:hypothetical protein